MSTWKYWKIGNDHIFEVQRYVLEENLEVALVLRSSAKKTIFGKAFQNPQSYVVSARGKIILYKNISFEVSFSIKI